MSSAVKQSALISLRGLLTSKPAVWLCSMGDCRTVICSDKVALAIVDGTLPASLKLPVVHSTKWLVDDVMKCVRRVADSCKAILHRVSVVLPEYWQRWQQQASLPRPKLCLSCSSTDSCIFPVLS